jgi:uncharacterized protein (DUF2461 family)
VSPKAVVFAAGAYMPGPDELRGIRAWMADHHEAFRKADAKARKLLGKLQGESLTRTPKGFDCAHPADDLIRRKQWYYGVEMEVGLATSRKLLPELLKRFRAAAPIVEMLNRPIGMKDKLSPSFSLSALRGDYS